MARFVQVQTGVGSSSAATTPSFAYTAGNFLVAVVAADTKTGIITMSNSGTALVWTRAVTATVNSLLDIWYAPITVSETNTITATTSQALNDIVIIVQEWQGVPSPVVLDQTATNSGSTANPTTGVTADPKFGGDLVINAINRRDVAAIISVGPNYNNFTLKHASSGISGAMQTSFGIKSGTFISASAVAAWDTAIATFQISNPSFKSPTIRPRPFAPGIAR